MEHDQMIDFLIGVEDLLHNIENQTPTLSEVGKMNLYIAANSVAKSILEIKKLKEGDNDSRNQET